MPRPRLTEMERSERTMRHAQSMLKKAQTRFRRAETILLRWQKIVRSYENSAFSAKQPYLWPETEICQSAQSAVQADIPADSMPNCQANTD